MKKVIEGILMTAAAAALLLTVVIGALVLYDAPDTVQTKAILILVCASIALIGGMVVAEEIKGGK